MFRIQLTVAVLTVCTAVGRPTQVLELHYTLAQKTFDESFQTCPNVARSDRQSLGGFRANAFLKYVVVPHFLAAAAVSECVRSMRDRPSILTVVSLIDFGLEWRS